MVLDTLACMNIEDFGKKLSDNIVLDVFIICQKLRHISSNLETYRSRVHRSS